MAELKQVLATAILVVCAIVSLTGCAQVKSVIDDDVQLKQKYPAGEERSRLIARMGRPRQSVLVDEGVALGYPFDQQVAAIELRNGVRIVRCDMYEGSRWWMLWTVGMGRSLNEDYIGYDENDRIAGAVRHIAK